MTDAVAGPPNAAAAAPSAPTTPAWAMYRALVGVGAVCGLLLVTAYEGTKPIIARNQAAALERAIFAVLPRARTSATFRWNGAAFARAERAGGAAGEAVYAAYDATGGLVGVAVEGQTMGYQDTIRVLWGWDPALDAIVGTKVLESRETPGLGDAIEKSPAYLRNFVRLDTRLDASGDALAHAIVAVKPGAKAHPWEVDTITGATISSTAVARLLGQGAAAWVPRLRRHLDALRAHGGAP